MTFFSEASANSSAIARFKTRQPQTVTSSATATASSEISLDDAYQNAYELAQNIANSQAQHDANILVQSVDTATIGEKIIYLGSSLLKDHIREENDNVTHTLIKDFTLPDGMHFHIQHGKKLHILENAHLTINKNNEMHIFGTANSYGKITVNGGKLVNHSKNTLTIDGNSSPNTINYSLTVNNGGTLINSDGGNMNVTNAGIVQLTNSSTFTNDINCICNINNGSSFFAADNTNNTITNSGTINLYDVLINNYNVTGVAVTRLGVDQYSTLNNSGIINVGLGLNSSNNASAVLQFIGNNNINTGKININYNSSDEIVPQSANIYATNSLYLNTDTNPNSGNGVINDYVSSTVGNSTSESNSVYNFTYNSTSNKYSSVNVPFGNSDFPYSSITVINQ